MRDSLVGSGSPQVGTGCAGDTAPSVPGIPGSQGWCLPEPEQPLGSQDIPGVFWAGIF